jgi:molecular chaperone GrpE
VSEDRRPPEVGQTGEAAEDVDEVATDGMEAMQTETESNRSRELAELEDRLRRALADTDNLRKRCARDVERERAAERARVAAAWLPIVDNLELALQHAQDAPGLVEGVRAVHDQAVATLARLGFPRFDAVGQPFDPVLHEAVGTVEDGAAPPRTVVAVVRPGYGTPEALLRPAGVVVARG